jgi:hypothetical protein
MDDVATFGFQLTGAGQQFNHMKRGNIGKALAGRYMVSPKKTATEFGNPVAV